MVRPNSSIEREQSLFAATFRKPASRETGLILLNAGIKAVVQRMSVIESQHLLWGVAVSTEAVLFFRDLGIDQTTLIDRANRLIRIKGSFEMETHKGLSLRAVRTLRLATNHSNRFSTECVEPVDIILGMAHERDGVAGRVLEDLGGDFSTVDRAVSRLRLS